MNTYAFWSYPQFPYLIGAEIDRQDGMVVYPKNYGGHCFRASFFLPHDLGIELKGKLSLLKGEMEDEEDKLYKKYKDKLSETLSGYGQKIK